VLRQLLNLNKAVHDAAKASGDARRAEAIETSVRQDLADLARSLPTPGSPEGADVAAAAAHTARQGQPQPGLGSPLPSRLEPDRTRRSTTPQPMRGTEQGRD